MCGRFDRAELIRGEVARSRGASQRTQLNVSRVAVSCGPSVAGRGIGPRRPVKPYKLGCPVLVRRGRGPGRSVGCSLYLCRGVAAVRKLKRLSRDARFCVAEICAFFCILEKFVKHGSTRTAAAG